MKRIATNSLTGWAVALLVAYAVISLTVPDFYVAVGVRIGLFASGAAALWKWWPAFRILLDRENPPHERGQVLSTLGIACNALGVVYNAVWWGTWLILDAPAHWLVTAHSAFGNYLIAIGLTLVFRSTDIKRVTVRPVDWRFVLALVIIVALAFFFLGTRWQESQQTASAAVQIVEARNECPDETPIAGNKGRAGWIYHMPGGPYYSQTSPEACFGSEDAARLAGYRPVGR